MRTYFSFFLFIHTLFSPLSFAGSGTPQIPSLMSVEPDLPSEDAAYIQAKQLLDKHKWDEADSAFRTLLKREPKSVPAVIGLATALTYSGRRQEALNLLTQTALSVGGSHRNILIRRVNILSHLFLKNLTFQTYEDGLNLMLVKKYGNARERFEKALADEPDNVQILVRLGQCLILSGDAKKAAAYLKSAKKLNPFEPQIKLWLGRALYLQGTNEEALKELTAAYDDLHGCELGSVWLAEALMSNPGKITTAIRLLENDVRTSPIHVQSRLTCARLRLQLSRLDSRALGAIKKELQVALSQVDAYQNLTPYLDESDLGVDLRKSPEEMKGEIQKLIQQVQMKIDQLPKSKS